MYDSTVVQLFWFFLFLTVFCGLLVVGGLFFHQLERLEYHRLMKLDRARRAWAKMVAGEK